MRKIYKKGLAGLVLSSYLFNCNPAEGDVRILAQFPAPPFTPKIHHHDDSWFNKDISDYTAEDKEIAKRVLAGVGLITMAAGWIYFLHRIKDNERYRGRY